MKNRFFIGLMAAAMLPATAIADITVKLPADAGITSLKYYQTSIARLASATTRAERGTQEGTADVSGGVAVIKIDPAVGGSRYGLEIMPGGEYAVDLFASPGDDITVDVKSLSPFDYTLSGTSLIDGINEIDALARPLEEKMRAAMAAQPSQEEMMAMYEEYGNGLTAILKDYIDKNPSAEASLYALLNLSGEDFVEVYDSVADKMTGGLLYPLIQRQYGDVQHSLELERRQKAMTSGEYMAPGFTLKNLEGKEVSLADFKGKWVILDFWGSWCIWCIKGFPELKEAYTEYKDNLEIIGIDCNEPEDAWRAGVAKYELPWVNVYCPSGSTLLQEYGVQGFPTKAIIDPQGRIRDITTGHNPEFFNVLTKLMDE